MRFSIVNPAQAVQCLHGTILLVCAFLISLMLAARSAYLVSPQRFLMKRNNYEPYFIVHLYRSRVNFFSIKDRVGLQMMKFLIIQYFSIFPSLCLAAECILRVFLPALKHIYPFLTRVLPSVRETKLHTHTKHNVNL